MQRVGLLTVALVVLLLGLLPVCYCGGDFWWLPVAALVWTLAFIGRCLCRWWFGGEGIHHAPPVSKFGWHKEYLLFLIPILLIALQLIPLGAPVRLLSPQAWAAWTTAQARARLTLYPEGSWENGVLELTRLQARRYPAFMKPQASRPMFSDKEYQVYSLLINGSKTSEIASILNMKERTVKYYLTSIYQALGVKTRAEALKCAAELGDI